MISRPTLILDEEKCRSNIRRMAGKADLLGLEFRPHFKTHQSAQIGGCFKEFGINKITVSSVKMAEYFAGAGFDDITLAFPVNLREMEQINSLASKIKLNLLIDNPDALDSLISELQFEAGIFTKIDAGSGRAGLKPGQEKEIDSLVRKISYSRKLNFMGFLSHAGHNYHVKNKDELEKSHLDNITKLRNLKEKYIKEFPGIIASTGDTPACSTQEEFSGIDEIRPGVFVFYDLMMQQLGACKIGDIAITMACPVISVYPERNEVLIYGGAIHFSKDYLEHPEFGNIFGLPVILDDELNHGEPTTGTFMRKLSQEHGIIKFTDEIPPEIKPGSLIGILPVHACLTAQCMGEYLTKTGKSIKMMR